MTDELQVVWRWDNIAKSAVLWTVLTVPAALLIEYFNLDLVLSAVVGALVGFIITVAMVCSWPWCDFKWKDHEL